VNCGDELLPIIFIGVPIDLVGCRADQSLIPSKDDLSGVGVVSQSIRVYVLHNTRSDREKQKKGSFARAWGQTSSVPERPPPIPWVPSLPMPRIDKSAAPLMLSLGHALDFS
jgi:hypothetical protein